MKDEKIMLKFYAKGPNFSYAVGNREDNDVTFLMESDELEWGEQFSYEGRLYNWCSRSGDEVIVEEFELKNLHQYDYLDEDEITCPYCGGTKGDSWEAADDNDEEECSTCGGIFDYCRNVEVSYSSEKVREPKIREIR